jgi:hypothetical protein
MEALRKRIWRALDTVFAAILGAAFLSALAYSTYLEFGPSKPRQLSAEVAVQRAERDRRPPHPDVALQAAVQKVSVDAGIALISWSSSYTMDPPTMCAVAATAEREATGSADPIVAKVAAGFRAECEFLTITRAQTRPVFEQIAATGNLPAAPYAFEVFHGDKWDLVAVFDSRQACSRVLAEASARAYGTKPCAPWQPRF